MELKVWVEGIQRVVCGVTEKTTCQDVVYALAHATGRTGRFTLIERWRNHERLLAPMDHPLRVLMKWGDHSNDVHFILQRTPLEPSPGASAQPSQQPPTHSSQNHLPPQQNAQHSQTLPRYGTHQPQARLTHSNTIANMNSKPGPSVVSKPLPNSQSFPAFEGPRMPPPYRDPPPVGPPPAPSSTSSASSLQPLQQQANSSDDEPRGASLGRNFHGVKSPTPMHRRNLIKEFKSHHHQQNQRQGPPVNNINNNVVPATGGASRFVTPPPQLRPPPPYPNPPDVIGQISSSTINQHHQVAVKNLREIVESQRARIISQRAEMAKFDAELEFLDRQAKEAEELSEEVARLEDILDARELEVRELRSVEDEVERTRRQEEDLEVRLSKLRHQLANCESELDSGRGKIQSLADSLSVEQKQATEEQQSETSDDEQQRQRRSQSVEIQELYEEIERQKIASDELRRTADMLEEKIEETERMLNEKRQVAEDLAQEMRELNLESLKSMPVPLVSPETSKSPTEGLTSRRKIVGSPRQLENAAPTPKNPQGVWV